MKKGISLIRAKDRRLGEVREHLALSRKGEKHAL